MCQRWFERAYRRNVVDMHITDHDERFLSEFDADRYVEMLRLARVQSTVLYAHSHVGLCLFPSRVGPVHGGLKGRDLLGDVIERCHRSGIHVVVYCSLIFDTMAHRSHPDWRIVGSNGQEVAARSRYGVCCPNSPYRDYVSSLAREICERYDFEGMRFDMTFWPGVCYCRHCQRRFAEEVGADLPRVVHWEDPLWVRFQRKREEWLVDFAALQTATVRSAKPGATVEHQSSVYTGGWRFGVTHELAAQNDFLQGDFYGDALQGSIARKLFYDLTPNRPGAFETCISVDLGNYTALKSRELVRAKACAALADASAFVLIDSIDPIGTLNPAVYERIGSVFRETSAYERYLGGALVQDVGVYLSTESKCDFADNGKAVDDPGLSGRTPHVEALVGACRALVGAHIPFGVITRRSLADLARHRVVVLPNVLMMDEEEAAVFREFVRAGGALYASRYTSLIGKDGTRQSDFLLADVFGVSYEGQTKESFTYMAPAAGSEALFGEYTRQHPMGLYGPQMLVRAHPDARCLGTLTLPYTDPGDPEHFASIHNNPPGISTDRPSLVYRRFGAGAAVYAAADIETADSHRDVFLSTVRLLSPAFSFEADAPACVEVTLFDQPDRGRRVLSLVNFQKELPNIPVEGIGVRVRVGETGPRRLLLVPEEEEIPFELRGDVLEFEAPRLETLRMFVLEW